jgi:hypothetical protein
MKKELLTALLEVQKELEIIKKGKEGQVGHRKFMYAPLEVVWENIKDILQKNGFFVGHEITKEGVITTVYHEHGELKSFFGFGHLSDPKDIGIGATYGKRYNIVAIFNIQLENEDSDVELITGKAPKQVNDISSL